ncbi:MAG: branched-chain amino acid ABC transporter permease [Gaiellaceae bacterium]
MNQLAQQLISGLALGSIYASLALALVLIYRATGIVNFAQGEIGMFATFIAWSLITNHGFSFWPAFALTLLIAFAGGVGLQRVIIRPVERAPELTLVMITIGLLVVLNGLAGWIWGPEIRGFPSPFPAKPLHVGSVSISEQDIGTFGVCIAGVVLLWAFFRFTKLGLGIRAASVGRETSRMLGVRVSWMYALGWGLAAVLSAVAGMMAAPSLFLQPSMMQSVLIYSFAGAVLGGIDSPFGAVLGSLALGVGLNLIDTYVNFITPELTLPLALAVLLVVLVFRPTGLFGQRMVKRV